MTAITPQLACTLMLLLQQPASQPARLLPPPQQHRVCYLHFQWRRAKVAFPQSGIGISSRQIRRPPPLGSPGRSFCPGWDHSRTVRGISQSQSWIPSGERPAKPVSGPASFVCLQVAPPPPANQAACSRWTKMELWEVRTRRTSDFILSRSDGTILSSRRQSLSEQRPRPFTGRGLL